MAKDTIHDMVKNALIKDGWTITHDPFQIKYEEFQLFADLAAERSPIAAEKDGQKIVVEIKTFAGPSFIRELQQALGQYEIYQDIIEVTEAGYTLYLAVSHNVYNDFFTQKATQFIIRRRKLNLMVVNITRQEVVQWIS